MDARWLTSTLGGTWRNGRGIASCPVKGHGRGRGDTNPSLSISSGQKRAVVFHCHAGCSQAEVLDALKRCGAWPPGGEASTRSSPTPQTRSCKVSDSEKANALWMSGIAVDGTPADRYQTNRYVAARSDEVRFCAKVKHPHIGGRYPAMLAAIRRLDGALCAVQRTFISECGHKADVKPVRLNTGALADGAVQLAQPGRVLGLAEGVETALSATKLFDVPVWAACGLRFDKITLPGCVKSVVIFADHDEPGLDHAHTSKRHFEQLGYLVSLRFPEISGADWNDVLLLKRGGVENG